MASGAARGDLTEADVLVVYDSRLPDSVAVAEYYAGSQKVPGGSGQRIGTRPGVLTVNLSSLPGGGFSPIGYSTSITYADFAAKIRDPLRTYLNSNGLAQRVRCIVLTKGIPHRIYDTDNPNPSIGDQPVGAANELSAGDLTCASVDSELVLLQQSLNTNENGGAADSWADGCILNPYWRASVSITSYPSSLIQVNKHTWPDPNNLGIFWRLTPTGSSSIPANRYIRPGDIYLVCRLDGNTVADVHAMLQRSAADININLDTATIVLDESASDGVPGVSDSDLELDNDGPNLTNFGDDYEQARDLLTSDGRFLAANLRYDRWSTAGGFLVGPKIDFGGGTIVNGPVLLLATYGANHSGVPGTPGDSATRYPFSFNYAPGAIFNTIESYNGRAFGGAGLGFVPQGQLADFLAAGGTFGIGNVWEPLSFSVPDNALLVRNFVLGNMTWAEAAYSSMPVISWMEIVVGDPLTRLRRPREDVNSDGRYDAEDIYAWYAPASRPPDLNRDGQRNRADFDILRGTVRFGESGNMWPTGR